MTAVPAAQLVAELQAQLGAAEVVTDAGQRELASTDFYSAGTPCTAIIRPTSTTALAAAATLITNAGYALVPRGGGMSYTGGYTPTQADTVMVDLGDMDSVIAVNADDMTVTAQAGATWETIYNALKPHGLRVPFFGTFSGRLATVGGGLSNGAVFFGTARYGCAADHVLGLEVVCADGRVLRTGQAGIKNGKAFYRTHGPDLTGLFLHDCGALGIKTEATFRLIEAPTGNEPVSFALPDAKSAAAALSAVARAGVAEEAYVFDPQTTARNMDAGSLGSDLKRLGSIMKSQGNALAGLKAGAKVVSAGKNLVPEGAYSLHAVCAGRSEAAARADADRCRELVSACSGSEIPNSVPVAVRAAPFDNLNGVLGPDGERWAALNAKVTHSDATTIIDGFAAIVARHQAELDAHGVTTSTLFIAMDTHAFSFEPVFHWPDRWLPPHKAVPDAKHLASLTEPGANPQAAALVAKLRAETIELFTELGAASNQIGRTYPWRDNLETGAGDLFGALKAHLDPHNLMNPGVLARRAKN